MNQLYQIKTGLDDLQPVEDTLVDILTRIERAVITRIVKEPILHAELFAINIISEGDRGFGEDNHFYEINAENQRIFPGDYIFRHYDKCTRSQYQYVVKPETTLDKVLAEFRQAGYEILPERPYGDE